MFKRYSKLNVRLEAEGKVPLRYVSVAPEKWDPQPMVYGLSTKLETEQWCETPTLHHSSTEVPV